MTFKKKQGKNVDRRFRGTLLSVQATHQDLLEIGWNLLYGCVEVISQLGRSPQPRDQGFLDLVLNLSLRR